MRITLRLSKEDGQKVKDKARDRGMTVSGLIRDMIQKDREQQDLVVALREIIKPQAQQTAALLQEIKAMTPALTETARMIPRIFLRVDLSANASPTVSKQLSEIERR
jgi:hypothetical protein